MGWTGAFMGWVGYVLDGLSRGFDELYKGLMGWAGALMAGQGS